MSDTPIIAIIPARLASTRLPNKVLLAETGKTLIQHVCEAAARSSRLSELVVATDDPRVDAAVRSFGGRVVMTSPDHPNGTSRLAEACERLGLPPGGPSDPVIVNVQGDEPEMDARLIDAVVDAILAAAPGVVASTAAVLATADELVNPNVVKVVRRADGTAMYFSRAPIPHDRDGSAPAEARPLRHVGLYCYRRSFLSRYARLAPTPLEQAEKLEQLRILEHGMSIAVAVAPRDWAAGAGIDTREQYDAFVERWRRRD